MTRFDRRRSSRRRPRGRIDRFRRSGGGARRNALRRGPADFVLTLTDEEETQFAQEPSHAPAPADAKPEDRIRTDAILLTTDLSDESLRAFLPTASLARALGKQIVLVHVVQELPGSFQGTLIVPPIPFDAKGSIIKQAEGELAELARRLGGGAESIVLRGSDVAGTIADYAERVQASLIAIASHGRSGFREQAIGSVADALLRRAQVPVFCIPRL